MDMNALVDTQPIPFYFFRILKKEQKENQKQMLCLCYVPRFVAWMFLIEKIAY